MSTRVVSGMPPSSNDSNSTCAFVPAMRLRTSCSNPFITAGTTMSAATPMVTPTIEIQASSVMKPVAWRVRR